MEKPFFYQQHTSFPPKNQNQNFVKYEFFKLLNFFLVQTSRSQGQSELFTTVFSILKCCTTGLVGLARIFSYCLLIQNGISYQTHVMLIIKLKLSILLSNKFHVDFCSAFLTTFVENNLQIAIRLLRRALISVWNCPGSKTMIVILQKLILLLGFALVSPLFVILYKIIRNIN